MKHTRFNCHITISLLIPLILLAWMIQPVCGELERISWDDLATHLTAEFIPLLELNVYDCPEDTEDWEPSCTVAQFIENTFYLWE